MSAQTQQEPSMEDILASIRKIISEDNKDESTAETAPLSAVKPNVSNGELLSGEIGNAGLSATNTLAPALVERREMQEGNAIGVREVQKEDASAPGPDIEQNQKPVEQPHASASIPGFVERKPVVVPEPAGNNIKNSPANSADQMEEPLHPAIANAKAFVSSNISPDQESVMVTKPETPVFENSGAVGMQVSTAPLVSPDSVERREEEERRNHPLRRGADREGEEFKNALMSPGTDDAVVSAFEQLKNSATDNLDGKVEALLRPMLREWLDNNLPSMVERLVRDEIERVSRGD